MGAHCVVLPKFYIKILSKLPSYNQVINVSLNMSREPPFILEYDLSCTTQIFQMFNLITRRNRRAREQGGIFTGILASWMQQHLWTLHKNFDEVNALCHTIELCLGEMTGKDLLSQEELSWYRTKFQVFFHMKNFSVPEGYFMSQELDACLSHRAVSPALLGEIIILNIRMA